MANSPPYLPTYDIYWYFVKVNQVILDLQELKVRLDWLVIEVYRVYQATRVQLDHQGHKDLRDQKDRQEKSVRILFYLISRHQVLYGAPYKMSLVLASVHPSLDSRLIWLWLPLVIPFSVLFIYLFIYLFIFFIYCCCFSFFISNWI